MLASLGSLASFAGAAAAIKSPEEMYVAFLKSRSVEDDVIQRLNLMAHYGDKTKHEARKDLERNVTITADKMTGLITLDANDHSPTFAAKLANAQVTALHDLLSRIAVTGAQQRRQFFAQQMKITENALSAADARFRAMSSQGGLPATEALALNDVQTSTALRAKIAALEIELAAMRRFATDENPDVQRVSTQLAALREQFAKFQQGGMRIVAPTAKGEAAISALRDLLTQQEVLKIMTRQYEMAKIDEAREGPLLQQVDVAHPPEKPARPRRALITFAALLFGVLLGTLAALVRYLATNAARDPSVAAEIAALRAAWAGKPS
jgi:uncharacterized protein involved in exopolysaccharide biosynthesis